MAASATQPPVACQGHRPTRLWSKRPDHTLALVLLLCTGVCSASPALADGFIFQVGPDGRLIDTAETTSRLRAFSADDDARNEPLADRLFLFAAPQSRGEDDLLRPVTATAAVAPRALRASPEILHAIEMTALRYGGHRGLRQAGLSLTDWTLFYRANIEVESAYNPAARSPVGAIGLGQLMPDTARDLGVDPHDIAQNLDGSARYLLTMLERFGDPALALAAYNAGPHAVTRHGGVPPFPETQGHVARVTAVFERLRGDLS